MNDFSGIHERRSFSSVAPTLMIFVGLVAIVCVVAWGVHSRLAGEERSQQAQQQQARIARCLDTNDVDKDDGVVAVSAVAACADAGNAGLLDDHGLVTP